MSASGRRRKLVLGTTASRTLGPLATENDGHMIARCVPAECAGCSLAPLEPLPHGDPKAHGGALRGTGDFLGAAALRVARIFSQRAAK